MTVLKIISGKLPEVLELRELLKIEFSKIRRRPFILIATMAAIIFPAPITILTAGTGQGYDFLYKSVINLGQLVLLVPVLCIVASMLFLGERDNNTLKALKMIPVSMGLMAVSKLIVLLVISVLYSILAFVSTVFFSMIGHMAVEQFAVKLLLCIATGIMVWVAALPCILLIIVINRNYILTVLCSFLYAVMGFIITNTTIRTEAPNIFMVLPVNTINRWLLPFFQNLDTAKYPFDINSCSVSTIGCVFYLFVYGIVSIPLVGAGGQDYYPVSAGLSIIRYSGDTGSTVSDTHPVSSGITLMITIVLSCTILFIQSRKKQSGLTAKENLPVSQRNLSKRA